ncbi:DNA polymerase III subunit alpha [Nafulsella turpanensis]|uniref:DNA polymerase III subunit alpha n=1 Tax=Nafulsella turpanensis TaxID=1265690 RepID=UPI000345310C|nr:PHP domain-containing protein [Nafulsella turpanensis]
MFLNCHTWYSLRFGTLSPLQLVRLAAAKGIRKLALTDINNTSCMLEFYSACRQQGIELIAGIEFRDKENKLLYIGLAQNNKGFYLLNHFLSEHSKEGKTLPERAPYMEHTYIIYPLSFDLRQPPEEHEFIGIRPQEVTKIYSSPIRYALNKALILQPVSLATTEDYQLLSTPDENFSGTNGYELHCLLQSVDQNVLRSRLDTTHLALPGDHFVPQEKLEEIFAPYPKVIENTRKLLNACSIHFELNTPKNRKSFTGSTEDDRLLLEKLAQDGFKNRYPAPSKEILKRFEREIEMIDQLHFAPYFLITHDIIRYAQMRGFRHVGRGSGANSLVAYCLGITEVDPIALNLYFERFINPQRSSPPDFDIDFSWDERDEIVDYIFKRYARGHVALLATVTTFQAKALIRELGKVFGLPPQEIESLLRQRSATDEIGQQILHYARQLDGFPNHLSIHAGGVLITEEPINCYSAKMLMPKGFPIVHFDMYTAEEFGFYKYDILSQRGLGHIKEAVQLVRENRGIHIDIQQTEKFKKDKKVLEMLLNAQTIGCFYIESPGMRGLLSKLRCNSFEILVAASSIIRPGVSQSGMMQEYIRRHNEPETIRYLHPVFEELLAETYGVMVYQEDVIKIAHHFAGLDLGEADVLRRSMSGKGRSREQMLRIKQRFFEGCKAKGHTDELSHEVWRQMESFAGYSFCKAHSASYAVESFQSLYLKAYYPLEFMVAVINNFGGFYAMEHYVHEARMCGATTEPPCVNHSQYLSTIKGSTIYLGFVHLKEFEIKVASQLIREREENGPYTGFADFLQRVPVQKEQLNLLIRINAFRFTGKSRHLLLWEKNSYGQAKRSSSSSLFPQTEEKESKLPRLDIHALEDAFEQTELLGFPLCSPFELLEQQPATKLTAGELPLHIGRQVEIAGYFVTNKVIRTRQQKLMSFASWIDTEGHFFDTTHFPQVLTKYPFTGPGCYLIKGKVVEEFGFPSIEVAEMSYLRRITDTRFSS